MSELTDARCNLDNASGSLDEIGGLGNYLEECLADIEDELNELEKAVKLQKQETKAPVSPTTDLSPEAIRRELEARTRMAKSPQ